jgi:ABC-type antimicrobial peptide transport system permease subunit
MVAEGVRLAIAGLLLGTGLSVAASRALPAIVPGVMATDAGIFLGAPFLLVVVCIVASWMAARRAAAIAPMHALRSG